MHSLNNVVTQAAVDTSVPRRKTTGSDEKTEQSLSCLNRIVEQIKKLIADGHTIDCTDNANFTPLHEACNHGHLQYAKVKIILVINMFLVTT